MQTERLGIITFLGIFVPGTYITGILFFGVLGCVKIWGSIECAKIFGGISKNIAISTISFFLISYLLGVLVRLFAPALVDRMSGFYLYHIRRIRQAWVLDVFPYEKTIYDRSKNDGMENLLILISRLNPEYGKNDNKTFFNYCKWFIDANNQGLSRQVQQAEALVRFLSGTTIALVISIVIAIIMILIFFFKGITFFWVSYLGLLFISLLCYLLILERFKHQRRREVYMVWCCTYIIVKSRTFGDGPVELETIIDALFFK